MNLPSTIENTSLEKISVHDTAEVNPWRYWEAAKAPFTSAIFVLPLLVFYELCVFQLPARELDNGAHQWINTWLMQVGVNDLVVPLLMFLVLFLLQYQSRKELDISCQTLIGMWAESILFAIILIGLGQAQQLAMIGRISPDVKRVNQQWHPVFLQVEHELDDHHQSIKTVHSVEYPPNNILQANLDHPRQRLISYLGAGIYEETLFRLLLIPVLYYGIKMILFSSVVSMIMALIISSLMFALAHEIIPAANLPWVEIKDLIKYQLSSEPYRQFVFAFRALAGLYFGILFYVRGFGIAVGAHLVYDVFVGIMCV